MTLKVLITLNIDTECTESEEETIVSGEVGVRGVQSVPVDFIAPQNAPESHTAVSGTKTDVTWKELGDLLEQLMVTCRSHQSTVDHHGASEKSQALADESVTLKYKIMRLVLLGERE